MKIIAAGHARAAKSQRCFISREDKRIFSTTAGAGGDEIPMKSTATASGLDRSNILWTKAKNVCVYVFDQSA